MNGQLADYLANGELADYITLWRGNELAPGRERLSRPDTFTPKARIWLRTSHAEIPGGHLPLQSSLPEVWALPNTSHQVLLDSVWLSPIPAEPRVSFVAQPAARWARMVGLDSLSWQAIGRGQARPHLEPGEAAFTGIAEYPGSLKACRPTLSRSARTLAVWKTNGLRSASQSSLREKPVAPPVRTWIGALKRTAPSPAQASKTLASSPMRVVNSYRRRNQPEPRDSASRRIVFQPTAAASQ